MNFYKAFINSFEAFYKAFVIKPFQMKAFMNFYKAFMELL